MPWADERLKRYPALMRRVSQRVIFKNLGFDDANDVMRQICDVTVSECAMRAILSNKEEALPVYMLYRWALLCESMARKYGVNEVLAEHLSRKGRV